MFRLRRRTYADRYAENWRSIARKSHAAARHTCCLCRQVPSQEVHHIRYRDWRGAIAGRERSGVDVFPVCGPCHDRLHRHDAWIKDHANPVLGNQQRLEWSRRLKQGYRRLSGQGRSVGWWVLLGVAMVSGYVVLGVVGALLGAFAWGLVSG